MPSYKITLVRIKNDGPSQSGVRYSDEVDREKLQAIVREKLRQAVKLDGIAYISVDLSNLPAETDL